MKKFLSMLLALVMVFALVACGGKTDPTPTTTPPAGTPDAPPLGSDPVNDPQADRDQ